ncbi:radical SAM protein [Paraburkholderia sp.]|uniref:radical SAM protein n=1 Tax=Paraburkholderia sp. TaxID=1926495 RepID=UPI0023A35B74|nr:radical SAM protein [Paraburkholderia sp.]MDE1179452.1 radical SAM protein [Paraburkholderia sp.]
MSEWSDVKVVSDDASSVSKYVFSHDDAVVEAVLYRYPDYQTRTVICCSTQSGCPIGCRFCGSGDYFVRSLTTEEIVSQPVRCIEDTGVDPATMGRLQIMFMSMGEPMLNMKALDPAIRELHRRYPNAALLISTSAPRVDYGQVINLSVDVPTVGLQFSVHESTDEARNELIPFKAKLTLEEIASTGTAWFVNTGRKPFFNYCAHDANSTPADADRILALFDPIIWCATVSVICERQEWLPTSNDHQRGLASDFASKLVERGYDTRMFDPAGQDTIGGGCGQLWMTQEWMRSNPDKTIKSIGFGKPKVHTPIRVECAHD